MGSWNKTCGLSNLHIYSGTPVYVFLLEKNNKNDDDCYATGLYSPLLLPFESEYNDYGGGENSTGVALPLILHGLKQELVEMPLGESQYHDIEVTKDKLDEELFFEAAREHRLQIKGRFSAEPTEIQFTMFRKDIVDSILEKRVIEEYVGGGKGTFAKWGDEKNYISYTFNDIVADIKPMIAEIQAKLEDARENGDEFAEYVLFSGIDSMFDYNCGNRAAQWMRHDTYRYSRIVDMKTVIREAFRSKQENAMENLEKLLHVHLKALFIDGFMHSARKTWITGGHEGSQGDDDSGYRLLCSSIIDALDKEKEED